MLIRAVGGPAMSAPPDLDDFLKGTLIAISYIKYQDRRSSGEPAMLRITVVESSRSAVTLRVEGRITGSWVEELRRACDASDLSNEVHLSLELAEVSFTDAAGIELLKELRSRGVSLVRTNPFMADQLKDGASSD